MLARALPFEVAREWVHRNLAFRSRDDWEDWLRDGKKNPYIPSCPDEYYSASWQGWDDWLGTPLAYEEARAWACRATASGTMPLAGDAHVSSQRAWDYWVAEGLTPPRMPAKPHWVYRKNGWRERGGYDGFLGRRDVVVPRPPVVSSRPAWDSEGAGEGPVER